MIAVPSTAQFKQTIENSLFAVIHEILWWHHQEVKWKYKTIEVKKLLTAFLKRLLISKAIYTENCFFHWLRPMQYKLKIIPSILSSDSGFSRQQTHSLCVGMVSHRSQVHQNVLSNRSFTSSFSLSLSSALGTRSGSKISHDLEYKHACQDKTSWTEWCHA